MEPSQIRDWISDGVVVVVLTMLLQAVGRLYNNRARRREQRAADAVSARRDAEAETDRESGEFARLQGQYGTHLSWDFMILAEVRDHRRLINELRVEAGKDPIAFAPIPDPPSLRPPPNVLPPPT